MSKYHATRTTLDGITFDSKKEAERYAELKLLYKCGAIEQLRLQPKFELQESFRKNGKLYRNIVYIADFMYFDRKLNKWVVEDVKGVKTKEYSLKKKLFEKRYPKLTITEVK